MIEHDEQVKVFLWAQLNEPVIPALRNLFAIPNGARTKTVSHAIALKAEGLKPGVPDIFFALTTAEYGGLFIEMKTDKENSRPTDKQRDWHTRLRSAGYMVEVCRGHEHAIKILIRYISLRYALTVKPCSGGMIPLTILKCEEKQNDRLGSLRAGS